MIKEKVKVIFNKKAQKLQYFDAKATKLEDISDKYSKFHILKINLYSLNKNG